MIQDTPVSADCRAIQFKQAIVNRILVGHVIKSVRVTSEIACEANCFENNDCMSVNFGPLEADGKHLCNLSNSGHDLHPEDLKERSEFIFKPIWVSMNPQALVIATLNSRGACPNRSTQAIHITKAYLLLAKRDSKYLYMQRQIHKAAMIYKSFKDKNGKGRKRYSPGLQLERNKHKLSHSQTLQNLFFLR